LKKKWHEKVSLETIVEEEEQEEQEQEEELS